MNNDEEAWIICGLVVIGTIIGVFFGISIGENSSDRLKIEAVHRGFAEWVVDDQGNAEWRWKE